MDWIWARGCVCISPLIDGVCPERVDAIDVRDVKGRLITGGVGGHLHQDLVQEDWLRGDRTRSSLDLCSRSTAAPHQS